MKHDFSFFLILYLFHGLPRMSYCLPRVSCSKLYKNGEALLKYEQAQTSIIWNQVLLCGNECPGKPLEFPVLCFSTYLLPVLLSLSREMRGSLFKFPLYLKASFGVGGWRSLPQHAIIRELNFREPHNLSKAHLYRTSDADKENCVCVCFLWKSYSAPLPVLALLWLTKQPFQSLWVKLPVLNHNVVNIALILTKLFLFDCLLPLM